MTPLVPCPPADDVDRPSVDGSSSPPSRSADARALKGRGTAWAIEHRFSREQHAAFDDGWGTLEQDAVAELVPVHTEVIEQQVKTILTGNDSPDINFDLSINPYRGCEHVMWRDKVLPDPCLSPLPDFF